jgi:hypothetical protein
MRLLRSRSRALTWLTAGVAGIGLLAGSVRYGSSHGLTYSALDGLAQRASAQEDTAAPPAPAAPARTNSKRPTGEVTQVTADPASFTVHTADGTLTTYRVLGTTVFMAGRDRPYRFDLLQQGDTVIVRGGSQGNAQGVAAPAAGATGANGRPRPPRAARSRGADGQLIARQVTVRPAGEAGAGRRGRAAGAQNGGSNAAGR